jgi:hypothetical protein
MPEEPELIEEQPIPESEQLLSEEPPEVFADVEAVQEEAAPDSEPQDQWRNDQYALGKAMGLEPDQVRGFPNPEAFDLVANQWASKMQQTMNQSPEVQQQQQQAQEAVTAAQGQGREVFEFKDPGDYDSEIVEMNDHYTNQMGQMQNTLNSVLMHTQRMQMEAAGREMDMLLNSMDEGVYGRGRLNELQEDNAMNRIAVADEVARLGHGYIGRGEGVPPLDVLVDRASQAVHGKEMSQAALQRVSDKASQVARQATALPQHRDDTPDSGYEAAVQAAANWQAEHGMSSQ